MSTPTKQEMLDNVNTAINAIINGGAIQEYTIKGQNIKKYSLGELMNLKTQLKAEIRAESGPVRTYAQFEND